MATTLTKDKCGCKTTFHQKGSYSMLTKIYCKKHLKEKQKIEKEIEKEKIQEILNNTEEVNCYTCHSFIGYVSAFDLEGTYFICKKCKQNHDNFKK